MVGAVCVCCDNRGSLGWFGECDGRRNEDGERKRKSPSRRRRVWQHQCSISYWLTLPTLTTITNTITTRWTSRWRQLSSEQGSGTSSLLSWRSEDERFSGAAITRPAWAQSRESVPNSLIFSVHMRDRCFRLWAPVCCIPNHWPSTAAFHPVPGAPYYSEVASW